MQKINLRLAYTSEIVSKVLDLMIISNKAYPNSVNEAKIKEDILHLNKLILGLSEEL